MYMLMKLVFMVFVFVDLACLDCEVYRKVINTVDTEGLTQR